MHETIKQKISAYTMKLRLYPSPAEKADIDEILRALQIAYNITFHEVFQLNPAVCRASKKDGALWPDFGKMAKAEWRHYLIEQNPLVEKAPAASITTNNGLFLNDAKRAWETGMHNRPIDPEQRKDFHFYHSGKPRRSFLIQISAKNLIPSPESSKVAWIHIPKVGRIKARGFNRKLWFGENGCHTYAEALQHTGELPKDLTIRVSKDTCGDYYVSITFSEGKKKDHDLYLEAPAPQSKEDIGIDVGLKDIAILSNGCKVENRHFQQKKQKVLASLNRQLSRRWGPANIAYRDYNKHIRQENRRSPEAPPIPLAQPSRSYLKTQAKKALIERKVTRRRNTYYHQQTAAIVRQSSMIATETLLVTNMMRNHKLARALADAAMSDFLLKIRYKADWFQVPVRCIGTFEPSSQLCSVCGEQNPRIKNLAIRRWKCRKCGAIHDRDINAARNILQIAITKGGVKDQVEKEPKADRAPPEKRRRRKQIQLLPEEPGIAIVFSKELTRHNDPRYVIKNTKTDTIIDDAQGSGYRSISNARNCYKAKRRWSKTVG